LFRKSLEQRQADGRVLSSAKREALKALEEMYADLHRASEPPPNPEQLLALQRRLLKQKLDRQPPNGLLNQDQG
jgi:hypothetical protein